MTSKHNDKDVDVIPRKEIPAYKYSAKGTSSIHEAMILQGQPCFVTWYPNYGIGHDSSYKILLIQKNILICHMNLLMKKS